MDVVFKKHHTSAKKYVFIGDSRAQEAIYFFRDREQLSLKCSEMRGRTVSEIAKSTFEHPEFIQLFTQDQDQLDRLHFFVFCGSNDWILGVTPDQLARDLSKLIVQPLAKALGNCQSRVTFILPLRRQDYAPPKRVSSLTVLQLKTLMLKELRLPPAWEMYEPGPLQFRDDLHLSDEAYIELVKQADATVVSKLCNKASDQIAATSKVRFHQEQGRLKTPLAVQPPIALKTQVRLKVQSPLIKKKQPKKRTITVATLKGFRPGVDRIALQYNSRRVGSIDYQYVATTSQIQAAFRLKFNRAYLRSFRELESFNGTLW